MFFSPSWLLTTTPPPEGVDLVGVKNNSVTGEEQRVMCE